MEKVLKIGCALFVVAVILSSCFGLVSDWEEDAYNEGYEAGHEAGITDGKELAREDGLTGGDIYYYNSLDDMDYEDIIDYIEDGDYFKVVPREDLQGLFAYALQRGYVAGKTGTWDSTMEEYVNGYDLIYDGAKYEYEFGLDPIRDRNHNGLSLGSWGNNGKGNDYSKVFDAWQDWAWEKIGE